MGRKKRAVEIITDDSKKLLCFKKRRINLIKKAMELSLYTNCFIKIEIFQKDDGSLLEYVSKPEQEKRSADEIKQHVSLNNNNYDLCR